MNVSRCSDYSKYSLGFIRVSLFHIIRLSFLRTECFCILSSKFLDERADRSHRFCFLNFVAQVRCHIPFFQERITCKLYFTLFLRVYLLQKDVSCKKYCFMKFRNISLFFSLSREDRYGFLVLGPLKFQAKLRFFQLFHRLKGTIVTR